MPSAPSQRVAIDGEAVAALAREPLDWRWGSLGLGCADGVAPAVLRGADLFSPDVLLPAMVLRSTAIEHNVELMASWCERHGALLAPHAKTTMAPQLMERQARRGCWAFTCATPAHLRVYLRCGVDRVFYANQLAQEDVLAWLAPQIAAGLGFQCLVDTCESVEFLDRCLARGGSAIRLDVLVERGHAGGRAGARSAERACAVAARVRESAHLRLVGLEAFEGLISGPADGSGVARVDAFLADVRATYLALCRAGAFAEVETPLLSAGGSAYFDRVVAASRDWPDGVPAPRLVLRSGCYITHDCGLYAALSPFGEERAVDGLRLRNAVEVWGSVLSRPEPELVVVGAGKRDMGSDVELPVPIRWRSVRTRASLPLKDAVALQLSDQHAHVRVPADSAIAVGDAVAFGVSHPCTTFDRWRAALLLDDADRVLDVVRTYF